MNFSTKIPIEKAVFPIDYQSKILSLGSCFAQNMGEKFSYYQFKIDSNLFGIIFNPISIEKLIERAVNQNKFTEQDIFYHNGLWHSFEVHSELSNADKAVFLKKLNDLLAIFYDKISTATHFLITYGTAWVYRQIETNCIVANCHKVPQKQFSKELLPVKTIAQSIQNSLDLIKSINPAIHFIATVSPVRHIKDGFIQNNWSKAHLFAALQELINQEPSLSYFPSYEIMMDELRDYRFYAPDMLHPSPMAIDYIWHRFKETTINETAYTTMDKVADIKRGLAHRPFNPDSAQHLLFLSKLNQKITELKEIYPHVIFL